MNRIRHFLVYFCLIIIWPVLCMGSKLSLDEKGLNNLGRTIAPVVLDYETNQNNLNILKDMVNWQIALGKTMADSPFLPIIQIIIQNLYPEYTPAVTITHGSIYSPNGYFLNPINTKATDIFLRWVHKNRLNPKLLDSFPFDLRGALYAISTALGRRPLLKENLIIHSRKIFKIPRLIGELQRLTHINLEDNLVCTIPAQVSKLKKLRSLNLSFNLIAEMPNKLKHLKNLEELNLAGNILCTLPNELSGFKKLRSFNVRCNFLDNLPTELGTLETLRDCSADLNHIPKKDFGRIRAIFTPQVKIFLQSQTTDFEWGTKGTPDALEQNWPAQSPGVHIGTIDLSAWFNLF